MLLSAFTVWFFCPPAPSAQPEGSIEIWGCEGDNNTAGVWFHCPSTVVHNQTKYGNNNFKKYIMIMIISIIAIIISDNSRRHHRHHRHHHHHPPPPPRTSITHDTLRGSQDGFRPRNPCEDCMTWRCQSAWLRPGSTPGSTLFWTTGGSSKHRWPSVKVKGWSQDMSMI